MKDDTVSQWTVDSFDRNRNNAGVQYKVTKNRKGGYHCTCEAFRWGEGQYCKHIEHIIDTDPLPDQERITPDEFLKRLVPVLQNNGGRTVVVTIKGNTITVSEDR